MLIFEGLQDGYDLFLMDMIYFENACPMVKTHMLLTNWGGEKGLSHETPVRFKAF